MNHPLVETQTLISRWAELGAHPNPTNQSSAAAQELRLEIISTLVCRGLEDELLCMILALPGSTTIRVQLLQALIQALVEEGRSQAAYRVIDRVFGHELLQCFQQRLEILRARPENDNLFELRKLIGRLLNRASTSSAVAAICASELYHASHDPTDLDLARQIAQNYRLHTVRARAQSHIGLCAWYIGDFTNAFSALARLLEASPDEAEEQVDHLIQRISTAVCATTGMSEARPKDANTLCVLIIAELERIEVRWAEKLRRGLTKAAGHGD